MRPAVHAQRGLTLVELLLAMVLTGLLMVPITTLVGQAVDDNVVTSATLAQDADLRFALDRIAARAAAKTPTAWPPAGADVPPATTWLAPVSYALSGSNLVETDTSVSPTRVSIIAANVSAFQLSAPDIADGQLLLTADITLAANGASVHGTRTIRLGGPQ